LVKKEQPMMKGQTKNLTGQVRDALLALPDTVLMEILARWLDGVDEQLLDWSDECRYALGYRIQSDETGEIYASFEELEQAEPDGVCTSWMVPDAQTLRSPEPGRIFIPHSARGRRKPMEPKSSELPGWRLLPSRHLESPSPLERLCWLLETSVLKSMILLLVYSFF
jgi:hypothetical protein